MGCIDGLDRLYDGPCILSSVQLRGECSVAGQPTNAGEEPHVLTFTPRRRKEHEEQPHRFLFFRPKLNPLWSQCDT